MQTSIALNKDEELGLLFVKLTGRKASFDKRLLHAVQELDKRGDP